MWWRRRLVAPIAIVVVAVAITIGVIGYTQPPLEGTQLLQIALGVCGVGFLAVAVSYARDGYRIQAAGHALAGFGFVVIATGNEGTVAWVGLLILGGGGFLLLRDALAGNAGRRPAVDRDRKRDTRRVGHRRGNWRGGRGGFWRGGRGGLWRGGSMGIWRGGRRGLWPGGRRNGRGWGSRILQRIRSR